MPQMARFWRFALGALLAIGSLTAVCRADLRDEVKVEIDRAQFRDATVAVSVRDAETGTALVSIYDDRRLIPASNMKLFTSGAALHILGPEFEFKTRLLADGDRLNVFGGGDPGFGDPHLLALMELGGETGVDVETFLDLWVTPIVDSGLPQVSEIVVDDRIFDRRFVHTTWPRDQLNRRYCAEVAGLNFHLNVLHFYPRPGGGDRPNLQLFRPDASWLQLVNHATTRDGPRDRNDLWIARQAERNVFNFYGNVKFPYPKPVPVTVHDPPTFFARLLAERLGEAGMPVGGYRSVEPGEPPSEGRPIGPIISTPISSVVTRCNRDSQNLYAESLLKRLAHAVTNEAGSWLNGAAVVRLVVHERLKDANLAANVIVSDGSGLSRENRAAAATVTAWLNTFHHDERLGAVFIESLAVAGESGTLRNRFKGVDLHGASVRGKSGYIKEVSCLSGYVTMSDGRERSFSILINGLREPGAVGIAKRLQERIVVAIAWDLSAVASPQLGSD